MNISNQLKGYGFSYFEETLWKEAQEMVDERLKGNRHRGAVFEAFIFLVFDHIVDVFKLKNKIRIHHNPFSFRKYVSRQGLGVDLMVYLKKPSGIWTQLFAVECKNWIERFMSPSLFRTHVLPRFFNIVKPIKILITKGIEYSTYTKNQIKNHSITQITNNYVTNIKQLIINKLPTTNKSNNNMSNSVSIHKTQKYDITTPSFSKFNTVTIVNHNNILCGG